MEIVRGNIAGLWGRYRLYVTGRLAKAQPDDCSSLVTSRWRRLTWRFSTGGGLRLRRRSPRRRSRTTSLLSSASTCLRYKYCFGSVRDTMKSKSAMIASDGYDAALGAVQWEAGAVRTLHD